MQVTIENSDALERRVAQALAPALTLQPDPSSGRDGHVVSWRRLAIADGVEVHVRDDSPAARDDVLATLRDAARTALSQHHLGT